MSEGIQSSFIRAVEYNELAMTLDVWMHNGAAYRYFYITRAMYLQFMSAYSKGNFYNS